MSYTKTTYVKFVNPRVLKSEQWNRTSGWVYLAGVSSSTAYQTTWAKTQTGTKVQDYQQRIRDGVQAGSDYSLLAYRVDKSNPAENVVCSYEAWDSTRKVWEPHVKVTFSGLWFEPAVSDTGHMALATSEAEAIALAKTYNKVRSEYQRLNAAASVAEFGDVIRQFGKPFEAIVDLTNRRLNRLQLEARGLKGSTSFRKIKFAEIVASSYLEYAFGLAPLISDAEKVAEALARFNTEKVENYRFRSRISSRGEKELKSIASQVVRYGPFSYAAAQATNRKTTKVGVQYVVGLNTSHIADFNSNDRLLQILGFKPEDWIPAVWEVVPWSWLVDYFTNVGEILSAAATSVHGVTWVCKTVKTQTVYESAVRLDPVESAKYLPTGTRLVGNPSGNLGSFELLRTSLTRSLPASLGVPPLVFEHPFKDVKKLANMAAVLVARRPSASALWLT